MKKLKKIKYILIVLAFIIGVIIFFPLERTKAATYTSIQYGPSDSMKNYGTGSTAWGNATNALFSDGSKSVNKYITIGNNGVFYNSSVNNNIYCLATDKYSQDSSKYYAYKIYQYLKIEGNELTIYPKPSVNGSSDYSLPILDNSKYTNAKMAYLLGGGSWPKGYKRAEMQFIIHMDIDKLNFGIIISHIISILIAQMIIHTRVLQLIKTD